MALRRLSDGTILSANVIVGRASTASSGYKNFGMYKAMILKRLPKDDPKNVSKKSVEYEAVITSGNRRGELVRGVMPMDGVGGKDNFMEVVYQPKTQVLKGKDEGDKTLPENTDGNYVLLGFMNGHYNSPVILGGINQPNNDAYGASNSDANVVRGKFQNLTYSINNDGKLVIDHSGTKIELDHEGNVGITTTQKTTINASAEVKVEGSQIELGAGAVDHIMKAESFKTFFDNHTHGGSPIPDSPLPANAISSKVIVE